MKIISWNVGGLKEKVYDDSWIEYVSSFDIAFFSETWIRDFTDAPSIECFNLVIFKPATKRKGIKKGRHSAGLCVYVKKGMIETKVVETDLSNLVRLDIVKSEITLWFIYNPPRDSEYCDKQFFEKFEDNVVSSDPLNALFAIGDWNARTSNIQEDVTVEETESLACSVQLNGESWDQIECRESVDSEVNEYGKQMIEMCENLELRIMNGRVKGNTGRVHSFVAKKGEAKSVNDYCVANLNGKNLIDSLNFGARAESDHMPIELVLNKGKYNEKRENENCKEPNVILMPRLIWDETKIEIVREQIDKYETELKDLVEIAIADKHESNEILGNPLEAKLKKCFESMLVQPRRWRKKRRQSNKLKEAATRALKKARSSRLHSDFSDYGDMKKAWREAKKQEWIDDTDENNNEMREMMKINDWASLWKRVNNDRGKYEKKVVEKISIEDWADYFDNLFNCVSNSKEEWSEEFPSVSVEELDHPITIQEVMKALKAMKSKSAPGVDGISTVFYKKFPETFAPMLAKLFNALYSRGQFPKAWARACIIPIFKGKGSKDDPGNYRGIALLPCIGKIFSKVLKDRLYKWVEEQNILSPYQAGFRRGHSTIDHAFTLNTILDRMRRRKTSVLSAFCDVKKAFDSVNRDALWFKLNELGVSSKMIAVLRSKYRFSSFQVRNSRGEMSRKIESKSGVIQGDQLSSLLFILYVNDFDKEIKELAVRYAPTLDGVTGVPMLIFADDLVLLSTSAIGLQKMIDVLAEYCREWRLSLNADKTKVIEFRKGRKNTEFEWNINGVVIERVKDFKYLGLNFEDNGRWNKHVENRYKKAVGVNLKLCKVAYKYRFAPIRFSLHLFDAITKAMLLYGVEILAFSMKWDLYERVARRFYKTILGQTRGTAGVGVEMMLGRSRMKDEGLLRTLLYWKRLMSLPDERLVKKAFLVQQEWAKRKCKSWCLSVKNELSRLGLAEIYEGGTNNMSKIKFKSLVGSRLVDQRLAEQRGEGEKMKSCKWFVSEAHVPGVNEQIAKSNNFEIRRKLARVMLRSDGAIVSRKGDERYCVECEEKIKDDIFVHRVIECRNLNQKRKKISVLCDNIADKSRAERILYVQRKCNKLVRLL